jgi:hypothetical protein
MVNELPKEDFYVDGVKVTPGDRVLVTGIDWPWWTKPLWKRLIPRRLWQRWVRNPNPNDIYTVTTGWKKPDDQV